MKATAIKICCYHCGDKCSSNIIIAEEKNFCCQGCKMVYNILNENNLCEYYDLNSTPGISLKETTRKDKFLFLDNQDIKHKIIQFSNETFSNCTLYIPQMHCSSCLWILENLKRLNSGILNSTVNFERKELFISFKNQEISLREVVEILNNIGYEPHFDLSSTNVSSASVYSKRIIYQLGIAGFCFANIMMLSFPEYLAFDNSVDDSMKLVFRGLSILLSIPIVTYCSYDLFKSAYSAAKNKMINIDFPVALAILITFVRSLYEIFTNSGSGYLDSMSGIVFFLLIGRWIQNMTYQNILFDRDYKSFFPISVDRKEGNSILPIQIEQIEENDELMIHNNEIIPTDALLSKGSAMIDYSFVNGESQPILVNKGEILYAGGKQTNGLIEVVAIKKASQSYLKSLWNKNSWDGKEVNVKKREDIISQYFTILVVLLGALSSLYWYAQGSSSLMWNSLTTVLIIACPCALLLATNFTNGNVLRLLGKNKFYIKNADILYKIQEINHIVFDKTGTLTDSKLSNISYSGNDLKEEEYINMASLLNQSNHPISKSVFNYLNIKNTIEVLNFKETIGKGIEGWIENQYYKIGSEEFVLNLGTPNRFTSLYISIDNEYKGKFIIQNSYRNGVFDQINKLRLNYKISILSGDNDSEKSFLENKIKSIKTLFFNQKPEDKLHYIESLQHKNEKTLMIGDGLNDAFALMKSDVGISVSEAKNNFTPAADIIIDSKAMIHLNSFLVLINRSKLIVNSCFLFSIMFNVVGLFYALQGRLQPIIAAILMMISSLTIIGLSFGMTQFIAYKLKLKTKL